LCHIPAIPIAAFLISIVTNPSEMGASARAPRQPGLEKLFKHPSVIRSLGCRMLEEASELIGMQVYTSQGTFLGNVGNLVVDVDQSKVQGLFITDTNPLLVEGSKAVNVPYRWISAIGDVVILRYFPKRVALKKSPAKPKTTPKE
jgi:sporulation protein YlmC with PRC-barrel domain